MQTAVNWMIDELIKKHVGTVGNEYVEIFEQAKLLHKQEILNSFSAGAEDGFYGLSDSDAEMYYETLVNGKDWSKVTLEMRTLFKQPKKD